MEMFGRKSQDQSRIGALVSFSEGSSYEVKLPESGQSLNLLVNLSPYLRGAVWGLLGTWDGDTTNEFTLPDGSSANDDISSALHNHLLECEFYLEIVFSNVLDFGYIKALVWKSFACEISVPQASVLGDSMISPLPFHSLRIGTKINTPAYSLSMISYCMPSPLPLTSFQLGLQSLLN